MSIGPDTARPSVVCRRDEESVGDLVSPRLQESTKRSRPQDKRVHHGLTVTRSRAIFTEVVTAFFYLSSDEHPGRVATAVLAVIASGERRGIRHGSATYHARPLSHAPQPALDIRQTFHRYA